MRWWRRRTRASADRVNQDRFRQVLSEFCSGIVVVTAMTRSYPVGLTCQSFSSLSLDPPLVMFAVARTSRSWPRIRRAGRFGVNILGDDQEEISRTFALSGVDKFAGLDWRAGVTGAPLITGALAHIECALASVHGGGDHVIAVGRVVALRENGADEHPLLYYRGEYRSLRKESLGHEPMRWDADA
jgi:3-hydroxy-9,10-secoandrosta-1,3,5(10)-triene-9,17-dione monooxygenase reductase component